MNSSAVLARLAVEALAAAGVTHVVLCPGSRSAPLAYAVHEQASAGRGPALHVRHDERVAAFTALGVGVAGPGIGAVVTTSGTAAANLHPAVLEAHHAGVPLVVVTADRPRDLRGTWANQTSDLQADLFGAAVRARLDLPDTEAAEDPEAAALALANALAAACGAPDGGRPGPVHLDLGFTDPLVPDDPRDGKPQDGDPQDGDPQAGDPQDGDRAADRSAAARTGAVPAGRGPGAGRPAPPVPVVRLPRGPRTVVVAGDGAGPAARVLAEAAGWPLLAEPSSGARAGRAAVGPYRLLLELPDLGGAVERVVAFGRPTLSRPVARLLARPDVEVVLVSPWAAWPEPGRPVRRAAAVDVAGPPPPADVDWLARWTRADAAAWTALDGVLVAGPGHDAGDGLTGPLVARELAAALAPDEVLVAAASNPVRDLDLAARPPASPEAAPRVLANRGLSGIDGTLSTATGVALATARRVRVLVGDLAFLHDLNGLLHSPSTPAQARPDLQVVVLNDDGGGIFSLLEHGERALAGGGRAEAFERLFGTPHGADLAGLCRGYAVPHRLVRGVGELRAALVAPAQGTSVVEVRADRSRLRDLHARIRTAVHAAARAEAGAV